jgi:hypothetical protein
LPAEVCAAPGPGASGSPASRLPSALTRRPYNPASGRSPWIRIRDRIERENAGWKSVQAIELDTGEDAVRGEIVEGEDSAA